MTKNKFICFMMILTFAGCTVAPFKEGQPIKMEGGFYSRTYKQDEKLINLEEMFSYLKKNEATKENASKGETWFYTASITGGIGGYLLGYNLVSKSDSKQNGLLAGAGFIGISVLAAYYAGENLSEAIDVYNQKLTKKSAGQFKLSPMLGLAETDRSQTIPTIGLSLSY